MFNKFHFIEIDINELLTYSALHSFALHGKRSAFRSKRIYIRLYPGLAHIFRKDQHLECVHSHEKFHSRKFLPLKFRSVNLYLVFEMSISLYLVSKMRECIQSEIFDCQIQRLKI